MSGQHDEAAIVRYRRDWEIVARHNYHPIGIWMMQHKWTLEAAISAAQRKTLPNETYFWLGRDADP